MQATLETRKATVVRLCGPLVVEVDGRRLERALPSRQGRLVFAYLVLHRRQPVSRDTLIEALWPGRVPAAAASLLTGLLSRLRRVLPAGALEGRSQLSLRLGPDAWVDVDVAEGAVQRVQAAIEAGRADDALSVAQSALRILELPLLPDLDRPWVDERRRRLETEQLALLDLVARLGLAGGPVELAAAESAARAVIEREPLRESAHELLMEALAARGDVAEALQVYDGLRVRLRDQLGTVPSASVRALSERLLRTDGAPIRPRSPTLSFPRLLARHGSSTFVGRAHELELLNAALERTEPGTPGAVLLEGEPGIGKSRLATEFARRAHAGGAQVLYGRCHEETLGAYEPFVEALGPLIEATPGHHLLRLLGPRGGELARLFPELPSRVQGLPAPIAEPEGERLRLFAAVAALLSAASRTRPVVLVVDDLHWADRPSTSLLVYLVRASDPLRLLLVGTSRDTEPQPTRITDAVLAGARHEDRVIRLRLEGLSSTELEALVSQEAAERAGSDMGAALFSRTSGNPFFARELLRHLEETGAIGPAELEGAGIPLGVQQAIEWRLGRLSDSTRQNLPIAALLGPDVSGEALMRAAGLDATALVDLLDEAVRAGLLVELADSPARYGWRHPLISETLVSTLTSARRAHHHHLIATALERHDPQAHWAELAHHFLSAAPLAGSAAKARAYAIRAADAATAQLAHDEAARVLRIGRAAVELDTSATDRERADLLLALGEAELRAGDVESSRETYARAVEAARRLGDPERLARAALGSAGGRPWSGLGVSDAALRAVLEEAVGGLASDDSALRARLLSRLATELLWSEGRWRGIQLSNEALAMARRVGDPEALAGALYAAYAFHDGPDALEQRVELAREMRELAAATRDLGAHVWADHFTLIEALERGEIELVHEVIRSYANRAATLRHPLHRWHAALWSAMLHLLAGRFEEAEREVVRAGSLGGRAREPNAGQTVLLQLATLRWEQGRVHELEPALAHASRDDVSMPAWQTALAHLYAAADRAPEALALFERLAADDFASLPRDSTWIGALANLSETCAYLGDAARAETLSCLLEPYGGRVIVVGQARICMGAVAYYLGILAATRGDHEEALRQLDAAAALHERLGARPRLANTLYALGLTLQALGRPVHAREALDRALTETDALGIRPLAERIRAARGGRPPA